MYIPESHSSQSDNTALELLESATASPAEICENDPEVKAAFDQSLRELAEDIIEHHPSLAHLLIGMSDTPCPFVHGQN